jgi:hypothetical protein
MEGAGKKGRHLLVDGFQRSRDRQVVLEFDRDALVCERFENGEDELCEG